MSAQAQAWAKAQQFTTDPTARHVLLVLADYAGPEGFAAHPPVQTLAQETGLSERTVRAKLDHLEAEGLIRRDRTMVGVLTAQAGGKPIWYDLVLDFKAPTPVPTTLSLLQGEAKAA
jgi:pyocin large subunit-like protein